MRSSFASKASLHRPDENFDAFKESDKLIALFMQVADLVGDPICSVDQEAAKVVVLHHIDFLPRNETGLGLLHSYADRTGKRYCLELPIINKTGVTPKELTQPQLEAVLFDTYRDMIESRTVIRATAALNR